MDDIAGQVDDATGKIDSLVTSGTDKINSVKDSFATLPTGGLGSVSSLTIPLAALGSWSIGGHGFDMHLPNTIDLSAYAATISLARTLQLWALTIFFGFLTVRALTWTQ
jgi:hypothetical protein